MASQRSAVEESVLDMLHARGYTHVARAEPALCELADELERARAAAAVTNASVSLTAPRPSRLCGALVWLADGGTAPHAAAHGPCVVLCFGAPSAGRDGGGIDVNDARELVALCRAYAITSAIIVTPSALNRAPFKVSPKATAEMFALRTHVFSEDQLLPPWRTGYWREVSLLDNAAVCALARRLNGPSAEASARRALATLQPEQGVREALACASNLVDVSGTGVNARRSGDGVLGLKKALRIPTTAAQDAVCQYYGMRPGDVFSIRKQYGGLQPYTSHTLVV